MDKEKKVSRRCRVVPEGKKREGVGCAEQSVILLVGQCPLYDALSAFSPYGTPYKRRFYPDNISLPFGRSIRLEVLSGIF
jgi:hypothetical protein